MKEVQLQMKVLWDAQMMCAKVTLSAVNLPNLPNTQNTKQRMKTHNAYTNDYRNLCNFTLFLTWGRGATDIYLLI